METKGTYSYVTPLQASAVSAPHVLSALPHINPPTSKAVLERLAASLTPPLSLRYRTASGATAEARHANQVLPDASKHWAYSECSNIINHHSKSFYFSARLLPADKRQGIMALYAFCRLSDDLVDHADRTIGQSVATAKAAAALNHWARLNKEVEAGCNHPVMVAWADTRTRYGIPAELPDDLLDGIRMDLTISSYQTWDDLWLYCYRVASTVGLMSMYVTGAETMRAVPYAVQLGVALQLTNILRDVAEDARAGRVYLPAEDMAAFGYTNDMLMAGEMGEPFIRLMQFQIARADALYESAMPGIALLPPDSRFAVTAAANIYRGILRKIEAAGYDVFSRRAHLSAGEKLRAVPSIWWKSKRLATVKDA